MTEGQIAAASVAVVVATVSVVGYQLLTKRRVERHLHSRRPLTPSEFGREYYAGRGAGEVATFILDQMQELADVNLAGVKPDDRINADLRLDELDSLATVEIITRVEERFGIQITDDQARSVVTLDDFVSPLKCRLTRGSSGRGPPRSPRCVTISRGPRR